MSFRLDNPHRPAVSWSVSPGWHGQVLAPYLRRRPYLEAGSVQMSLGIKGVQWLVCSSGKGRGEGSEAHGGTRGEMACEGRNPQTEDTREWRPPPGVKGPQDGTGPSPRRNRPCQHLWESRFLSILLPRVWEFVTAAPGNKYKAQPKAVCAMTNKWIKGQTN